MRILHLVTLVSPDGAFGGPLKVALNQAAELRRRGHEVHIAAGWRGHGRRPESLDGTPASLFPTQQIVRSRGNSGIVSMGLFQWLAANVKHFDVVHIHAGRDLTSTASMVITRHRGRAYVVQTHGMVAPDDRAFTRVMDLLFTRRLLRAARTRLVLTQRERNDLEAVLGPQTTTDRLMNGVPSASRRTYPHKDREVLFCARLHQRKRPVAFVEVADVLTQRGVSATYALVGPDGGELSAVLESIHAHKLGRAARYEGALDYGEVLDRMSQTGIYVLPSVDEPFPMTLLEAMSLGVPSLCTSSCGVADILRERRAAIVTGESVSEMADGLQKILDDEGLRSELSANSRKAVAEVFSMAAVGDQLERIYRDILSSASDSDGQESKHVE